MQNQSFSMSAILEFEHSLFWYRKLFPSNIEAIVSYLRAEDLMFNETQIIFCYRSHEKLSRLEVVTSFKAKINPIKSFAEKNAIKVHDWAVLSNGEKFHLFRQFDLGLVVSFGHLIPEEIINSFKKSVLVSLL